MRRMKTTTNTKSCKATRSFASLVSFPKQTHKQTDDSPFIIYTIHTHQHKRKRSINHLYSKTSLFVFLNRIDSIFFLHLPFLFLLGFFLFLLGVSDLDFVNRSDPAPFPFFSSFCCFKFRLEEQEAFLTGEEEGGNATKTSFILSIGSATDLGSTTVHTVHPDQHITTTTQPTKPPW